MEWVETTGRTVEEALEGALDQLGVDEADAEYEVLEEPKLGLFGRLRTEARLRARVRPATPRAKDERRGRKKPSPAKVPDAAAPPEPAKPSPTNEIQPLTEHDPRPAPSETARGAAVSTVDEDITISGQGEVAVTFLRGLLDRFGAPEARIEAHQLNDETVEIRVDGDDLGRLIGPKGAALQSLQELTRTVVQRQTGARSGRILVDVSGYRQRRREALEKFATKVAEEVRNSGVRVVLEPMIPADRKVVHDTVNGIEGVTTTSEGEEPQRRVVVSPESR